MSHMLRVAFAATSLFGCPACVTTGTLDSSARPPLEATEPPTGISRFDFTPTTGTPAPAAPPAPTAPVGGISRLRPDGSIPVRPEGSAALLAWEQSRAEASNPRTSVGTPSLLFEPSGSRLRLVLNMLDGQAGSGAAVSDAVGPGAESGLAAELGAGIAALWEPVAGTPEVLGLDSPRVEIGSSGGVSANERIGSFEAELQNTPEPGTLALAVLGLFGVGVARRLRRA